LLDNKVIKNFLFGIGLIFLILGQIRILNGGHMISGGVLTLICGILFFLAFTEKYLFFISAAKNISTMAAGFFARKTTVQRSPAAEKKSKTHVPAAAEIPKEFPVTKALDSIRNMFFDKTGMTFRFEIPKWLIFTVVVLLFGAAQYLMLQENLKIAVLILAADALLLVSAFLIKGKGLNVEFSIESGLKVLSFIAGAVLLVIGWILLINQKIITQEWGVVFTIPGAILLYLGLPKSNEADQAETDRSDILFLKPDFLNNYVVKAIMLVVAFALLKAGVKVMQNPDYNMYSMLFYAAAGVLVFLAMPLFNFSEKQYDSRILDFIKLGVVIGALAIAYRGQTFFVKHDINNAINHYFVAAILFILAFPVYAVKEKEEKEHFPLSLEVIFLVAITAVGAFLRFYELDVRPFGIENDEAGGLTARMSRTGETTLHLPVGNFGIYAHIVRIFIALYGGMDRVGIRLTPVIVGIIAIPVIYFFIRNMFNAKTAMFATVVFAFLRWDVYYSRYTSPIIMSLCAEALALYFFFKAIETKKKLNWFMAGLCIGLTWHGPMTFFLLIVPFIMYFLITALTKRGYFKSNAIYIAAFMCGLWIFGSMIMHNYFISKRIYFARVAEVSVFSKDPNAPSKNPAKGIVEQTKQVLLMFNHAGDSRQRNSGGQPYEPTVDFLTSMLFAIGFLYAIYYSKYYQFFIMVMVFFSQAAGSIFSIEAPSAMRAVGTMIPMLYFVAFTFDRLWMAFRRSLGKRLEFIYLPVMLLVFTIPIARDNYKQYFERWIGGMDELSTAAGMYSAKLGDKTRIILYTSTYYPGHPPYKFFRWDYKVNSADRFTTGLTRLREITDEDFAIFFHYDTWGNIESIRNTMFPEAKIVNVDHKFFNKKLKPGEGFGDLIKSLEISNAQIKKARGLTGAYSFGGEMRPNEEISFLKNDDSRVPYSVTWKGQILIPYYGKFRFVNKGASRFSLQIDGHPIDAAKETLLAEGFHKITVSASRNSQADKIELYMESKMLDGSSIMKTENINLDSKYLYNYPSFGLHGYFYRGAEWTGNQVRYEVNSTNMCFGGGGILTESAIWKGNIKIPLDDAYVLTTRSNGYVRIIIDGKYFWEQNAGSPATAQKIEKYFSGRKLAKVNEFLLTRGKHTIEIYCMNTSLLELIWSGKNTKVSGALPVDLLEPDYQISKE
jgi:hypothetical protein